MFAAGAIRVIRIALLKILQELSRLGAEGMNPYTELNDPPVRTLPTDMLASSFDPETTITPGFPLLMLAATWLARTIVYVFVIGDAGGVITAPRRYPRIFLAPPV